MAQYRINYGGRQLTGTSQEDVDTQFNNLFGGGMGAYLRPFNSAQAASDAGVNKAEAQAEREVTDWTAEANQKSADRTNSLAQMLASARRTPGGGIRRGIRGKGLSSDSAGNGLVAANAADKLATRKRELVTAAQAANLSSTSTGGYGGGAGTGVNRNAGYSLTLGAPIQLW